MWVRLAVRIFFVNKILITAHQRVTYVKAGFPVLTFGISNSKANREGSSNSLEEDNGASEVNYLTRYKIIGRNE